MPDQEPCLHLALAFDVDDAATFQQELVIEMLIGVLRHLNLARLTRRFHTRSYIHSIAPHVVEKFSSAHDACHHRAAGNAKANRHTASLWIN